MSEIKTGTLLTNRPGTFAITTLGGAIFENETRRQELKLIMETLVILQATHITSLDQIAYVALCEQFELTEVGDMVPGYIPMFELDEKGKAVKCVWEKAVDYLKTTEGVKLQ